MFNVRVNGWCAYVPWRDHICYTSHALTYECVSLVGLLFHFCNQPPVACIIIEYTNTYEKIIYNARKNRHHPTGNIIHFTFFLFFFFHIRPRNNITHSFLPIKMYNNGIISKIHSIDCLVKFKFNWSTIVGHFEWAFTVQVSQWRHWMIFGSVDFFLSHSFTFTSQHPHSAAGTFFDALKICLLFSINKQNFCDSRSL